eukprot:4284107-Ditylum_brightwellii.AAC.1
MAAITHNNKDLPTIQSPQLVLPQWIEDSNGVILELNDQQLIVRLMLEHGNWKFKSSTSKLRVALPNFALTYKSLLDQQMILPGWHSHFIPYVSAGGFTNDFPDYLLKSLANTFSNRVIWYDFYIEEMNGLIELGTFHEISLDEYC